MSRFIKLPSVLDIKKQLMRRDKSSGGGEAGVGGWGSYVLMTY